MQAHPVLVWDYKELKVVNTYSPFSSSTAQFSPETYVSHKIFGAFPDMAERVRYSSK